MAGSDAHPYIGTKLGSRDTADRPQTAIEWCVLGLLALSLLSYPFYLKFLAFGAYQAGILLLFAAMLLLFLAQPSYGRQLISNRAPAPVTFFAVMYAAYFFFMLLASLFHRDIGDPAVELARSITKIAFATILYVSVRTSVFRWLFDRFTQLITITAAAAVLLHSLLFFRAVSPIMTLHLAEDGVSESRNFYLLGLTWGHILTVGGHGFIRLQSFSDEPGTYAFALLVAIIWAIRMKWKWSSAVMVCALALTLSAGGIITGLLLLIVLLPRQSLITKAALVLLVSLAAWGVASINSPFFNLSTYTETKFTSHQSSAAGRFEAAESLISKVSDSPEGFGIAATTVEEYNPVGVGFLSPLASGGVLGFVCYVLALCALAWMAIRGLWSHASAELTALACITLVLLSSSLQRATIDSTIWHWWLIVAMLRIYSSATDSRHQTAS